MTRANEIGLIQIKPEDPGYRALDNALSESVMKRPMIDYNAIAREYNDAMPGSFIVAKVPRGTRKWNVAKMLQYRGLHYHTDFELLELKKDDVPVAIERGRSAISIKKITAKPLKVLAEIKTTRV